MCKELKNVENIKEEIEDRNNVSHTKELHTGSFVCETLFHNVY